MYRTSPVLTKPHTSDCNCIWSGIWWVSRFCSCVFASWFCSSSCLSLGTNEKQVRSRTGVHALNWTAKSITTVILFWESRIAPGIHLPLALACFPFKDFLAWLSKWSNFHHSEKLASRFQDAVGWEVLASVIDVADIEELASLNLAGTHVMKKGLSLRLRLTELCQV